MLQRLAQFRVALLEFLEQTHVLDGDDSLICESFDQSDLLVGEWLVHYRAESHYTPIGFLHVRAEQLMSFELRVCFSIR